MNINFRVTEYCYSTVLYFSSAVIALNWPFPSLIAFTHQICIFPYIHSCRKTEGFALDSHCPPAFCLPPPELSLLLLLSSVKWRWHLPQSIMEKEQRVAKKESFAFSEKLGDLNTLEGSKAAPDYMTQFWQFVNHDSEFPRNLPLMPDLQSWASYCVV